MTAGLVLAAGAGTRFGPEPKLLAPLRGRPLLEHAVAAMCGAAALERVVVVLGSRSAEILAAVTFGRAEPVICEEWAAGQSASLRTGVAALQGHDRVLVALGDAPDLNAAVIARVLSARPPARAVYAGRPGHPVLLGRTELAAIPGIQGDQGARGLLRGGAMIECGDLASGHDIDTPGDLIKATKGRGTLRAGT